MPSIIENHREVVIILAGFGVLLIVLNLRIRYRSAKRGSFLNYGMG